MAIACPRSEEKTPKGVLDGVRALLLRQERLLETGKNSILTGQNMYYKWIF